MKSILYVGVVIASLGAVTIVGCASGEKPAPLAPQFGAGAATPRAQKEMSADPLSGSDQPGALYPSERPATPDAELPPNGPGVRPLSKTVQENVTAPGERPADVASTQPAAEATAASGRAPTTIGTSSGQYFIIGCIVGDVNGKPIYANKLLSLVEPVLAARAKELDPARFRLVAGTEITHQMIELRNLELEYAAAERKLDQKDKDLADALTMQWKQRQITSAGGSLELAKRAAAERGENFDDLVQQQYRVMMSRIFYEKKIIPLIAVSAADMRAYYDRNRDREFNDRGVAQFRLIKIDVRKHGGRDAAYQLAGELRNRIVKAGEAFDAIARSVNDDPRLLRSGGEIGKIQQGAFAIDKVDQAVWATPDGQVTDIIDAGDALYLAHVLEKKPGHILPFEDESVQAKISDALRTERFRALRQQVQEQLVKDAVVRTDPEMMNTAVEMAMQNYPKWAGK